MLLIAAAALVSACGDGNNAEAAAAAPRVAPEPALEDPVLVGAGDIASCRTRGHEQTAALLDAITGTIFTVGDNAYQAGARGNPFTTCYARSWGRHRARTRPSPGNHEYEDGSLGAYFDYFGARAGDERLGYYSYDLGKWHILSLNTMLPADPSSPQGEWLRRDLAANRSACTLAYFHHPRFSSGPHPTTRNAITLWPILHAAGVDVVLAGHDHIYERFSPMDASGRRDDARGMRQFTVGTGGARHYAIRRIAANSEVRTNTTFGVLALTLRDGTYDWRFVPVRGKKFRDSGTGNCH